MKKVVVFLADGFEEVEGLTVVDLLRRAGAVVETVSVMGKLQIDGAHGIQVEADELFEKAFFDDAELLVLPGGMPGTLHLKEKVDGRIIHKTRYVIPMSCVCPENADFCSTPLFLELDIFHDELAPLILAEIEFPDEETANTYPAPQWLGEDVTFSSAYHNSTLSRM